MVLKSKLPLAKLGEEGTLVTHPPLVKYTSMKIFQLAINHFTLLLLLNKT